jgi:diacylglycerol O-acyltransferase
MKKLHFIDDLFLRLENRNQPMHIGMLMMLEPPANAPDDFAARIVKKLRQSVTAEGVFNQRLVEKRGVNHWKDNEDFDLEHHFVHLALPKPGRIRELFDMVSRLHCGHLDRAYPLWRVHLIEGIDDGRIAIYLKIHHSMIDGMSGMGMVINSMSTSCVESKKLPPFWEVALPKSNADKKPVVPPPATTGSIALRSFVRDGWRSAMPVIRKLRKTFKDFQNEHPDVAMAGEAPKCVFNQPISGTRRFSAQSYSTKRIKTVARALDATSNDAILAMVSGALRKYLEERGELPDMSLTAGVPISIRSKDSDSEAANQLASVTTTLATNIDDPVERMRAIKRAMDYNKAQLNGLTPKQMLAYSSLEVIPGALNVLLGRKPDNAMGNVVVSHVPGPRKTLYWQGAKLTGIYPISVLVGKGGLNLTIVSRQDNVDFGIIACRKTVPHAQRLLTYLEEALCDLESQVPNPKELPKEAIKARTVANKAKVAAPKKKRAVAKKAKVAVPKKKRAVAKKAKVAAPKKTRVIRKTVQK